MLSVAGLLVTAVLVQDAPVATDSVPRRFRITALPVVSYSDVTGLQYGATVFRGFRVGVDTLTRSSSIALYAARTAKGHTKSHLQLDRWSSGNSARWRARVEHVSYPLPFFGIGAETPDSAEEWYSSGVSTVQLFTQRRLRHAAYVHTGVRYARSRLREAEPDRTVAGGTVPGSSGSDVVSAEVGLVIDSRDNLGAPRSGTYARLVPSLAAKAIGSDFAFRRLTVDARRYRAFGASHVAAIQVQYDGLAGTAPFDQMAMIGADTAMRGYPRGRYRDNHAFTVQAEVRSAHWRRVGAVVFAGAGTVAPSFSKLASQTWYPSVGAGLRYLLVPKDRTVARVDLGIGRGSFGISVGIGEAF